MDANEIRRQYLEFFQARGHKVIPRAKLIPENDPTTLFTGSGMQPMITYLLGEKFAGGEKRIADSQPVFRTVDIEELGDSEHLTNFEMLGNWSLGDYFKKEQIPWIAGFLFDVVKLDPNKIYVSCYIGNKKLGIPKDEESIELWIKEFGRRGITAKVVELGSAQNGAKFGMQGGRIFVYDGKENWWSRNGDENSTPIGDPCGPSSEMFYDFGEKYHDQKKWGKPHPASDSNRFFEIGNNVFMGYQKVSANKFVALEWPNIDHGSGLERLAAAALDNPDVFKTSLLWPIIEKLQDITKQTYESQRRAMQVIADHIKAAYWLAVDGVVPSNKEQGYVMRRLIRRAVRHGLELGIEKELNKKIAPIVADTFKESYPEMGKRFPDVVQVLDKEEALFRQTLQRGLRVFERMLTMEVSNEGEVVHDVQEKRAGKLNNKFKKVIFGRDFFELYDTYGFPPELTFEEAKRRDIQPHKHWQRDFKFELEKQRDRSRTATKGEFKGGLGGQSEIHKKYHTVTHLMYKALREVLGKHVTQRGSNITEERTRFDFSHHAKMTDKEKQKVEEIVNQKIAEDLLVTVEELPTKEAFDRGAYGAFGDKYGDKVKVYRIGKEGKEPFSYEICGGPHVEHTGQIGEGGKKFKITKEESSSAGVRRIKAVLQ